jgi:hypothetical protein
MTALHNLPWGSDNSVPLDVDEAVSALDNSRRRHVIRLVADQDGTMQLGDVAEAIAAIESGKPVRELDSQERKRVYVGLYQVHLTKLDEVGAVAYDSRSGAIRATEATTALADLIQHIESVCGAQEAV